MHKVEEKRTTSVTKFTGKPPARGLDWHFAAHPMINDENRKTPESLMSFLVSVAFLSFITFRWKV